MKYHHLIAVDKHHRMRFVQFLKVYGQDILCTTLRQKLLIRQARVRNL